MLWACVRAADSASDIVGKVYTTEDYVLLLMRSKEIAWDLSEGVAIGCQKCGKITETVLTI